MAKAREVETEELTAAPEQTDKGLIVILNLSALSFILFPLLGIVVPLAVWALAKKQTKRSNEAVKQILSCQILWCIIMGCAYSLVFTNVPVPHPFNLGRPEFILVCIALLYVINFAVTVTNIVLALNSKKTVISLY